MVKFVLLAKSLKRWELVMTFDEWFDYEYPEEGYQPNWMDRLEMKDIMSTAWEAGLAVGVEDMGGPINSKLFPNNG